MAQIFLPFVQSHDMLYSLSLDILYRFCLELSLPASDPRSGIAGRRDRARIPGSTGYFSFFAPAIFSDTVPHPFYE